MHRKHRSAAPRNALRPLALAVLLALAGAVATHPAWAQSHGRQASAYDLPAGSLDATLTGIARRAGRIIVIDPALVSGRTSAPVRGSLTVEQAFAQALAGSGLEIVSAGDGGYTLRRAAPVPLRSEAAPAQPLPLKEAVLPVVTVRAEAERETATGPVVGYVARRSATATKTDTPIIETPQSISVIGRDEFEARGALDLEETIRYTPGVTVSTYGVDNRGYEFFSVRGFDGDKTSYRDGLRQYSFSNVVGLTEMYGLERVEILRGPSSMLFGQGDASGVVNRISKMPAGDALREVELQYGSFNRRQAAADVGGALKEDGSLAFRVTGLARRNNSNNATLPNGEELKNERLHLAPSIRWQPAVGTSLVVLGELLKSDVADDIWYLASPGGEFTTLMEGEPRYSRMLQSHRSVGYQFEHRINDVWIVRQNFRHRQSDNDKRHIWSGWEADGRTLARTAVRHKDRLNETSADTQAHANLLVGSIRHTVLFGMDWSDVKGTERSWTDVAPSLDLYVPIYGLSIPDPTTPGSDYTQTTRQWGFYVQDQIKLVDRWVLTVGGRQDTVRIDTDDRFNATRGSQEDSAFSRRAGVTYLFDSGWAPYVSHSESFTPNLGVDGNNQAFRPSRGKQLELGIKFQPDNARTLFTAALFDLRKTNVVTYDETTWEARQIGKQRTRGLELEVKSELTRWLKATASYTRLDTKVLESANDLELNKTPIQVPKNMASVWLDYGFGGGFGLGGGVRHVGNRWNDDANTSEQPSFTLVDAALHFDTGPWRFALNVTNLFDKQYVMSRAWGGYYLGPERSVVVTAKYRF